MSAPVQQLGIVVAVDGSPTSNAAIVWAAVPVIVARPA
jgi:hypothetical protein